MELYLALITFTYIYIHIGCWAIEIFILQKNACLCIFWQQQREINLLYCWNVKPSYHSIHSITAEKYCTWTKRNYKYEYYWVESIFRYKLCLSVSVCVYPKATNIRSIWITTILKILTDSYRKRASFKALHHNNDNAIHIVFILLWFWFMIHDAVVRAIYLILISIFLWRTFH